VVFLSKKHVVIAFEGVVRCCLYLKYILPFKKTTIFSSQTPSSSSAFVNLSCHG
jgi:hypothetical protein